MRDFLQLAIAFIALSLTACASTQAESLYSPARQRDFRSDVRNHFHQSPSQEKPGPAHEVGDAEAALVDVDYFQGLLVRAGVPPKVLPKNGHHLSPQDAIQLLPWLMAAEVSLKDFGPWRMAAALLWEVARAPEPISRQELHARMRRFAPLLVLRPDGYLVKATTGRAIQYVDTVRLDRGALRAWGFAVGPFYAPEGDWLFAVNGALEVPEGQPPAGRFAPDEDTFVPVLEGAKEAVADTVRGIVALAMHPIQSLEDLSQLPEAVRALIENSPQYWEQFKIMPHGAQVRSVSRLLSNVVLLVGSVGAGSTRAVSAAGQLGRLGVPVLSLSAEGALALRVVAVPVGRVATAIGTAPSAVYVLHMAQQGLGQGGSAGSSGGSSSWKPPPGGPGKWVRANEHMELPARKYQSQVTGAPEGWVYRVFYGAGPDDFVDFDGFVNGVLREAKGPGYLDFFTKGGSPEKWFKGAQSMLKQGERQLNAANGLPIEWHFAEREVADAMRKAFNTNRLDEIKVVHTPVLPEAAKPP
jgi:hypothetical protein